MMVPLLLLLNDAGALAARRPSWGRRAACPAPAPRGTSPGRRYMAMAYGLCTAMACTLLCARRGVTGGKSADRE